MQTSPTIKVDRIKQIVQACQPARSPLQYRDVIRYPHKSKTLLLREIPFTKSIHSFKNLDRIVVLINAINNSPALENKLIIFRE